MNAFEQLQQLSKNMFLELESEQECRPAVKGKPVDELPITEAVMPNGRHIKLLKTMITSICERNCYYCPFRAGRDMHRATFTPDGLAETFMKIYQAKAVEGMFLSSGVVGGGVQTQDKLINTAEILRNKFGYRGYLHLKIMPGVEKDQLLRAMQLASRISINLEAPNDRRLHLLAPKKIFSKELIQPLKWAEEIRREESPHNTWNRRWPSSATQFVVGAVGESDLELITTSSVLFNQFGLKRIYFSRFNPIHNTPLENLPPENPWRQHRLYQSSYLLRDYHFNLEEMPFDTNGNLPLDQDPKLAWAHANLKQMPVEVNQANRELLLRIPGIGPKGADTILIARRQRKFTELKQLKKIGIITRRAAEFILLDGKRPAHQLRLM
jgi:predicted DNA-binding helix-hairpin-helix protein